ncbi:glycosyltransferase family 4 protein [Cellulosimicrobium terreum]|nr:glycosyltransferase family 4 protein [Cellulosimicrobium terreum]
MPETPPQRTDPEVVLVAHPSAECYGSDLQMVESVTACLERGARVVVTLPGDGPLVPVLRRAGARVLLMDVPVLRKALANPRGLVALLAGSLRALRGQLRMIRQTGARRLLVNTLTLPSWIVAGRIAGVRVVCHVHEAEDEGSRAVRTALATPLLAAHEVVANSQASRDALARVLGPVGRRTRVVHNGVPGPPRPVRVLRDRSPGDPALVVLVGRLSPRKGTDVALDAVAALRAQGRQVRIALAGTVFDGYEWFEEEVRERAAEPDLAGAVEMLGYVDPWPWLGEADVVVVPSRVEPFGNVAVEAMLAGRPVVASRTQGLAEVVRDGVDGVLVPPGDPDALASALSALLDDPVRSRRLGERAGADARTRFSPDRYREAIWASLVGADAETGAAGGGR